MEAGEAGRAETPDATPKATLALLNEAHGQLIQRKQLVEKGLQRFDDLRRELDTINAQIESLEATLAVFGTAEGPEDSQLSEMAGDKEPSETSGAADDVDEPKFTGNKRAFLIDIVKSRSASGITPMEIDQIFSERKIARGKNLIYNALSILVKQGSMRRKDGRYFAASSKGKTS